MKKSIIAALSVIVLCFAIGCSNTPITPASTDTHNSADQYTLLGFDSADCVNLFTEKMGAASPEGFGITDFSIITSVEFYKTSNPKCPIIPDLINGINLDSGNTGCIKGYLMEDMDYCGRVENPQRLIIIGDTIRGNQDCSLLFNFFTNAINMQLSDLDTSGVTDMTNMFSYCLSLTSLDLSNWDVSGVKNMGNMFYGCSSLKSINLSGWNTSAAESMTGMFEGCSSLPTLDLSSFDTSKVCDMRHMFYNCNRLGTIYVSDSFNVDNVVESEAMFEGCIQISGGKGKPYDSIDVDKELARIDGEDGDRGYFTESPATPHNLTLDRKDKWFANFGTEKSDITEIHFITSSEKPRGTGSPVSVTVSGNTDPDKGAVGYIVDNSAIYIVSPKGKKTYGNPDSAYMFSATGSTDFFDNLEAASLYYFDTSGVTDMSSMFECCTSLMQLDISDFDTSSVTSMSGMFSGCSSLIVITFGKKFDTSSVTSMSIMFNWCSSIDYIDISAFDISTDPATHPQRTSLNTDSMFNQCGKTGTTVKIKKSNELFWNSTELGTTKWSYTPEYGEYIYN